MTVPFAKDIEARYQAELERHSSGKPIEDQTAFRCLLGLAGKSKRQFLNDAFEHSKRNEWRKSVAQLDQVESEMFNNANDIVAIENEAKVAIRRIERRQNELRHKMDKAKHAINQLVSTAHCSYRTEYREFQYEFSQMDSADPRRPEVKAKRDEALQRCVDDQRAVKVNFT